MNHFADFTEMQRFAVGAHCLLRIASYFAPAVLSGMTAVFITLLILRKHK